MTPAGRLRNSYLGKLCKAPLQSINILKGLPSLAGTEEETNWKGLLAIMLTKVESPLFSNEILLTKTAPKILVPVMAKIKIMKITMIKAIFKIFIIVPMSALKKRRGRNGALQN